MFYFSVITIFPEVLEPYFKTSIIGRAQKKKVIKVQLINPRNFVFNRHRTVDDNPYGGGPGMVMKPEPLIKAVLASKSKIKNQKSKVILLSPRGKQFNQAMARNLAKNYKNIILICGRYEGIDERVKKITKAEEISIGPYVLTGGELAALAIVDAVSRHIKGVLGKEESLEEKKGSYPVYTRPEVLEWQGKRYRAPKVLVSGNHKKIEEWRRKSSHLID
ncbi:MAG: tRNA (guanine-N(1)-)-methyltransferase [Parcubacteria group bacterium GW2011_GWB1_41_6]|nr:MAG: tRNA (guanine-N(1)-)-methyltransferase [Parcubacteria group bacterium GW2011_GWB1_41_6]KKS58085.1 MAG: tRNA (guanine-N(1)-)-methyltransferase [Parcubacteria group bacterium GW2011_GWA2_42_35]KKS72636.1 MAG: tRNA (guanine-N(1)-)-methyltransferase [Parcubacteria group bacterium GW2011_GWF2_42_7]